MSPDDRRAALVDATLPLLRELGASVSTRQIADAAGVAEGTIFRAFPDKNALLVASVIKGTAFEARAGIVAGTDMTADLRTRLAQATEALAVSLTELGRLPEVMRSLMLNPENREVIGERMHDNRTRTIDYLSTILEPDRQRLRVSLRQAARITLLMIFSSHGPFDNSDALTSAEIVAVLMDGLLVPSPDLEVSAC